MKISIDIEDFYMDSENESNLEKQLKEFVIHQAVQTIWKRIDKMVEDQVDRTVKNLVENNLSVKIAGKASEIISTESLNYNGKQITIAEFIKQKFLENSRWGNPASTIKGIADKFGLELRSRYDTAFATQIVVALEKNNMLKEGAGELLLKEVK